MDFEYSGSCDVSRVVVCTGLNFGYYHGFNELQRAISPEDRRQMLNDIGTNELPDEQTAKSAINALSDFAVRIEYKHH